MDNVAMEKTATSLLNAELLATCGALGWSEGGKYYRNPECLQSLKDLIRYLRNDDESHEVRRQLGAIGVVEADLLPLVKNHGQEKDTFDVTLRLLVNLTNPAIVLFKEELPEEKVTRNYYQECVANLQKTKRAFADTRFWKILSDKLRDMLDQDWENKEEDDNLVMERILILTRNVLHVPSNPEEEMRTDDDVSIHDQVIWAIHSSGMTDLILYIAANEDTENFVFHIIEIIFHMLREQEPEHLASAGQSRPQSEKEKDVQALVEVRAREKAQKMAAAQLSRFPRFNGSFCVKNVKSVSENDLIVHRHVTDLKALNFDQNKKVRKVPKNRRPLDDPHMTRRSTLNIRLVLKDFCADFLENGYNTFMAGVKEHLTKQRAQDHDETYYMWAVRFFMEFHRLSKMDISRISETVSKSCYHYIHTQIETYSEMMITDKRAIKRWSKRTYLALRAYKELILTLASMMANEDKKVSNSGRIIAGTIFYVMEYRDLLLHLLNIYDPQKYPKSYLKDLVEANHVFLKTLEQFCGQNRHMIVQKKKNKKKVTKKKAAKKGEDVFGDEQWEGLADALSHTLQGGEELPADVTPFDATSDRDFDQQKTDALVKIQDALRERQLGHAVSLLRASRDLWPEGEVFGSTNSKPEIDFLLLREIFFTQLPRPDVVQPDDQSPGQDEEQDEEELEEAVEDMKISEQEFNFFDFITKFARPKVVQAYCGLLSRYRENSALTNHCLLKMMHRIAWDLKMYGMFFQASLFRTFQHLLEDPARNSSPLLKEMCRFAVFVLRKFFERAKENKKLFMEMLFWKSTKEVVEIQEGYGVTKEKSKAAKLAWTEEEDAELKALFERFSGVTENGKDAIDLIQENSSDSSRTRRQIVRHLKVLGLIDDVKEYAKKSSGTKTAAAWSEEELSHLTELFEKFSTSTDIMSRLFEGLHMKKSKRTISKKLLELGLVTDRKQLYKKGSRRSRNQDHPTGPVRRTSDDESNKDSDTGTSEDSEDEDDVPLSGFLNTPKVSAKVSRSQRSSQVSRSLSLTTIKIAFDEVSEQNLMPAVDWLKESLESAAEDREEDVNWEPVPLVTFTEDQSSAMSNTTFLRLAKALGLAPPANEQESFWRVPVELSPVQLREWVEILDKAKEGQLVTPVDEKLDQHEEADENWSDFFQRSQNETSDLSKSLLEEPPTQESVNSGTRSDGEEYKEPKPKMKKKRRKAKFILEDDDDSNDASVTDSAPSNQTLRSLQSGSLLEDSPLEEPVNNGHSITISDGEDDDQPVPKKKKRKANFVLDDDDEYDASLNDATDISLPQEDTADPKDMNSVVLEDDEEINTSVPRKKRPKVIQSDDDE